MEDIKVGMEVTCIDCLEHNMKDPEAGPSSRYILEIRGIVKHVTKTEVKLTIEEVASRNMKKDKTGWIQDRSVYKRPPYDIGDTYVCRPVYEKIDNAVSMGKHVISVVKEVTGK